MEIQREKVIDLVNQYCSGNLSRFSREIGVDPSHSYRCLHNGIGGGKKMVGAIMKFCTGKGLDFKEYIDL